MKKYFIAILIVGLFIATGIYQIQSEVEIEAQNKNIIEKIELKQSIESQTQINPIEIPKIPEAQNNYIIMKATAYTQSEEEGTSNGITRSGTQVSRGTVAVDPKTIPLGTKLYIEDYGHAIALDVGGDIKHDRIDLYMDTKDEAFEFGRKDVKVWIIED